MKQDIEILTGVVIDDRIKVTTRDICHACATSSEWVIELVQEGVLEAEGQNAEGWRFSGATLSKAIRARRLQRDFDLNAPGVALVLDMMDEIERLRQRLRQLG